MSKDARTLMTLVAAFILPAYYHTFIVPYLSNECSTLRPLLPAKHALQAISASVYGMDAHRLQGKWMLGRVE